MKGESPASALLDKQLSRLQKQHLEACSRVASRLGTPIYLVGGTIRDLLLTGQLLDLDLDIAAEGSAIDLAREVAADLDGELRTHPRFLSAEVRFAALHLDIVSTRSERYEAPASLPVVSPASLETDLGRRDFTINAMALPLGPGESRDVIDPFRGEQDLQQGLIRVLHDRSFFDDPTRILRGVRLAARLGLDLEDHTASLAKEAIEAGAFSPLSPTRFRQDLLLLLEDRQPEKGLRTLETLGFLRLFGLAEPVGESEWQVLRAAVGLRESRDSWILDLGTPRWWLVYLMCLFWEADDAFREALAKRLELDSQLSSILVGFPDRVEQAQSVLGSLGSAVHDVCRILDGLHPEERVLLLTKASPGVERWMERWTAEMRNLRLTISGSDLRKEGYAESPALGRALEATLEARLDGRIRPDQELEFAARILDGESA